MKFTKLKLLPLALSLFALSSCNNDKPAMVVKVMSYNIQHGIDHKKREEEKKTVVDLNPVVDIVKRYDPDVLNINEIYNRSDMPEINAQVRYLGEKLGYNFYFVHGADVPSMGNGDYGGALLSKFPIVEYSTHPIPNPRGLSPEDLETRAIGQIAVKLPNNHILKVLQSHFGGISNDPDIRNEERKNAIETLLPLVRPEKKAIFMGDLNLVAGEEPDMTYVNQIKDVMDETVDERLPTFDSLHPTKHIDYMFCSRGMEYSDGRVLNEVYADHLPIVCEFKV